MIDPDRFTRTLTGFDEIAIQRLFGAPLGDLEGGMIPRALLFVQHRRAGASDTDAYRTVMELPFGDLEEHFAVDPKAGAPTGTGTTGSPTS